MLLLVHMKTGWLFSRFQCLPVAISLIRLNLFMTYASGDFLFFQSFESSTLLIEYDNELSDKSFTCADYRGSFVLLKMKAA